jgi:metallophosphoesterase
MNLQKINLHIGLEKPLTLLHLSDTHIILADERDDERKRKLAEDRVHAFGVPQDEVIRNLDAALDYAKANCDLVVHTGDLIDFVSHPNLDILSEKLSAEDTFFAVGNHEFSLYVGEAKEDTAYKMQSFNRVRAASPNDLDFASRIVNGVNLVAVDNGYYLFTENQLERLKKELQKGLPVILLMHNPIHTETLYDYMMNVRKSPCAYLTGTPEELLSCYPADRREQQRPDKPTLDFIEYIKQQPQIKAVFAGHLHFFHQDQITGTLPQFIAGGGFNNEATEYRIS